MKNKLITVFLLSSIVLARTAAGAPAAPSIAALTTEIVKEKIQEKIKTYKDSWQYWAEFTKDVSEGNTRAVIRKLCDQGYQIIDDAKKENSGMPLVFKIFQELLPEAAGPIGLILTASDFATEKTQAWIDWARKNRVEEVFELVLEPSRTAADVDSKWREYLGNNERMTLNTRGMPPTEVENLIKKIETDLLPGYKRMLIMKQRAANAPAERLRLRELMTERLEGIRFRAQKDIEMAVGILTAAKQPVNAENVKSYLKNPAFQSRMIELARGAGATGGSSPELSRIDSIASAAQGKAKMAEGSKADFSGLLREYGLNAERLITNNTSAPQYLTEKKLLEDSAGPIASGCRQSYIAIEHWKYTQEQLRQNCDEPYTAFYEKKKEIDANLGLYAERIKKGLEQVSSAMKGTDLEKVYEEMRKNFTGADSHSLRQEAGLIEYELRQYPDQPMTILSGRYNSDPRNNKLSKMEADARIWNSYLRSGQDFSAKAEAARQEFLLRTDTFRDLLAKQIKEYYELYNQNQPLTEYLQITPYSFSKERAQLETAEAKLSDNDVFFSQEKISKTRAAIPVLAGELAKLDAVISANKTFIKSGTVLSGELDKSLNIQSPALQGTAGKALFDKYSSEVAEPLISKAITGIKALALEKGSDYKPGRQPMDLASHQAELASLVKATAELEQAGLEGRDRRVNEIYWEIAKQFETITVPSQEAEALRKKAGQAKKGFSGSSPLAGMTDARNRYAEAINQAGEFEEYAADACMNGSLGADYKQIYSLFFGGQGWVPGAQTLTACRNVEKTKGTITGAHIAGERKVADAGAEQAAVRTLYNKFKAAYESRSAARVMSFISDDWSAGDGITASDLNEQFNRIFRLFDEISVDITGLQVVGNGNGMYTASYHMVIRSKIYKKNIKREESSSVYEHVEVSGNAARIKKTEAGGYWNIK